MNEHDLEILGKICDFCEQINDANKQFDSQRILFEEKSVYRNAVALCVIQIGELVKGLSTEYKSFTLDEIPWHQIQGLRNIVVHQYGKIDNDSLWETITEDIPALEEFCRAQISQNNL